MQRVKEHMNGNGKDSPPFALNLRINEVHHFELKYLFFFIFIINIRCNYWLKNYYNLINHRDRFFFLSEITLLYLIILTSLNIILELPSVSYFFLFFIPT